LPSRSSILVVAALHVSFDLPALAPEADEFRPTAEPDFVPTFEEEAEAAKLLNAHDEPTDAEWDARAEEALALDRVCYGYYVYPTVQGAARPPSPGKRQTMVR
jgi:hypothetical protein